MKVGLHVKTAKESRIADITCLMDKTYIFVIMSDLRGAVFDRNVAAKHKQT